MINYDMLMNNWLIIVGIIVFLAGLIGLFLYLRHKNESGYHAEKNIFASAESALFDDSDINTPHSTTTHNEATGLFQDGFETEQQAEADSATPTQPSELIIVLFVIAQHEIGFSGTDIFEVLQDLGLVHGKKRIFHHYGLGESKTQHPIFSIANIMEPGVFNPEEADTFHSQGLALFMQLPGPFGGRVAFELMMNTAQRIADTLSGIVENDRHQPVDASVINELRQKINQFEQR